jgi:SAM-dependent methyltransferase
MDGPTPSSLHLWDNRRAPPDGYADAGPVETLPFPSPQQADTLAARESWRLPSSRKTDANQEPFSLSWFLQIERKRYARHGHWLPKMLEFHKHRNERLLALGNGLGTDWARYAEHGAEVIVCHPSTHHLAIVRRHMELRNLKGHFLQGPSTALPVRNDALDVVCLSDVPLPPDKFEAVVAELYRVLKPGGKVIAVLPAFYNARYWQDTLMPWHKWLWPAPPLEPEARYSAKDLIRLFAQFTRHRVHKRHLRRSDLPHIWRWMALQPLERLLGRFLILKAYKPIRAALPVAAAA